ncbi:MAG: sulfatase [Sedimentisphaerales bacterium]|nr:sulfatase [Sedimentisphaerales bacterium]
MNRRDFIKAVGLGVAGFALQGCVERLRTSAAKKPNFVIIFTDDQGYADVGSYGAKGFKTPHLDRMAEEGMRFTDFYVAGPVCSPSRAALLTGCYPQRVGMYDVIGPKGPDWTKEKENLGLSDNEQLISNLLKDAGYATGCFGKWHVGHYPRFLPTNRGFDEYFGLPYSNDMWPKNSEDYPDLPLYDGDKVIETNPDQTQLTTRYTERAIKFIEKNKDKPFFVYLPHSMPHVPLYVSDKFAGKSEQGLYGDVIMEIDWSVGQINATLKRLGLDDNTLVIFTSDNGPWLSYGNHAGSALPLREGKGTTFDGGQRVPCIMKYPGIIPAGTVCTELCTTMDFLPTIVKFAGAKEPRLKIDGYDIRPLLEGKQGAKSPYEAFYFYKGWELEAVRSGKWKLHLPHGYRTVVEYGRDAKPGKYDYSKKIGPALFDLENDISEKNNVADKFPRVVARLKKLADKMRNDLGDSLKNTKGSGRRQPGRA